MDRSSLIKKIKEILKFPEGQICSVTYSNNRRLLALLYLKQREEIEAIYNLTESHSIGLRQRGLIECARSSDPLSYFDYLSFVKGYAKDEVKGMLDRLSEMPSEWTILQITRKYDSKESFKKRKADNSPGFNQFHLTRLPCGSELQVGCPITELREWPGNMPDIIDEFWKIKKQLGTACGSSRLLHKIRNEASSNVERHCREIGQICFKEWLVLCLGTLCDKSLSNWIRTNVDHVLNTQKGITKRQKYMTYLLAEGVAHISEEEIECALFQLYPENTSVQEDLYNTLQQIKSEKSNLAVVRRHPLLLILDEHLDLIPWENILVLRRHPISRVPSIHFAHALFNIHCKEIKNGLRELDSKSLCYYVLNPSGDLRCAEERLKKFIAIRFPSWIGIVGQEPTKEQLVEALTSGNTFIYCGHGSGCQYLGSEYIQRLKVKPVQLLFGCSSAALKDHGGCVETSGDFLQFSIAGSGCTLGTLWPVTSKDVDQITLTLANLWLPGDPIDINTYKGSKDVQKESELLRAIVKVRKCAELFSNSAGFVARGIPIKLSE